MSRKDDRVPREEYEKLIRELEVVVFVVVFFFRCYTHDNVIILSFGVVNA